MVACDISPGEELTWDYGSQSHEIDLSTSMRCLLLLKVRYICHSHQRCSSSSLCVLSQVHLTLSNFSADYSELIGSVQKYVSHNSNCKIEKSGFRSCW